MSQIRLWFYSHQRNSYKLRRKVLCYDLVWMCKCGFWSCGGQHIPLGVRGTFHEGGTPADFSILVLWKVFGLKKKHSVVDVKFIAIGTNARFWRRDVCVISWPNEFHDSIFFTLSAGTTIPTAIHVHLHDCDIAHCIRNAIAINMNEGGVRIEIHFTELSYNDGGK